MSSKWILTMMSNIGEMINMIYWCNDCGKFVYIHDLLEEGVCPFCAGTDLQITDEDEQ